MIKKEHITTKGTTLPILNLRGKEYLEVKYRLVWFREEHPDYSIETEFILLGEKKATAKATIRDNTGRILATGHKTEDTAGFGDFAEKAETGAIGRTLALLGYGTQFCADELDEGERIVDAPAKPAKKTKGKSKTDQPIVVHVNGRELLRTIKAETAAPKKQDDPFDF
jgi:hypothetical protein